MTSREPPFAVSGTVARTRAATGAAAPTSHAVVAPEAHAGRALPSIAPDLWLLAVSLAAGLGTARLTQAPGAAHVVGPITATVVAGHLGASVARRLRLSMGVVVIGGVVAVVLATIWGQLLSATRDGIPTLQTWRTLLSKFDTAGGVIRSHPTPVPATPEIVLCIATGAGLVAVLSRALWAWQEDRRGGGAVALLPTFGLFCYTALLSSQIDRLPGVVTYVVAALGFVIVADRATSVGTPSHDPAGTTSTGRRLMSGVVASMPAVLVGTLAVVVPVAASPALAMLKVNALPFPTTPGAKSLGLAFGNGTGGSGGSGGGAGANLGTTGVRAIDLVDNLKAVLVNRTSDVMFDAQTPLPTYWQVAVLTDFDGTAWQPDPTTEAAAQSFALSPQSQGVPGLPALPEPQATKTFQAQITIGDLESTLLPLPPTTYAVDTDADLVPGFGAVQPVEAAPGLSYVATARVPVAPTQSAATVRPGHKVTPVTATTTAGSSASSGVTASDLAPYLQLPHEPAPVVALAHEIVADAKGPAAEAAALARWFDSGRFRYTLSPPVSPGPDALETFLFATRAGFCQQFAAAYGVLARIDGLPTRVAVGFTTGDSEGHGRYQITGADAHVWPEVYLGPATGWTSYEPTPASSGEATGVGVNSGSKSSAQTPGAKSTPTTASTFPQIRRPLASNVSVPTTIPRALRRKPAPSLSGGSSSNAGEVAGIVVALVALALMGAWWLRRLVRGGWDPVGAWRDRWRRRRRRPALDPTAEVLAQWHDAARVLERARLGRRPAETLEEHASRLKSLAGAKWLMPYRPVTDASPGSPAAPGLSPVPDGRSGGDRAGGTVDASVDAYAALAALAARASYGSNPCTPEDAADAEELSTIVRSGLAGPPNRRKALVPS